MPRKKGIPNMHHQKADRLTIRIDAEIKQKFEELCNASGVSMTERLNFLIFLEVVKMRGNDGPETPQA